MTDTHSLWRGLQTDYNNVVMSNSQARMHKNNARNQRSQNPCLYPTHFTHARRAYNMYLNSNKQLDFNLSYEFLPHEIRAVCMHTCCAFHTTTCTPYNVIILNAKVHITKSEVQCHSFGNKCLSTTTSHALTCNVYQVERA